MSKLVAARFAVPRGFVLSADAYRSHLWASGAREIASAQVDAEQRESIREAILRHPIPQDVWNSVAESYKRLSWQTGIPEPKVAVRSSAIESGTEPGFAGAYESYLNVAGLDALDTAIKRVWASLWSGKAAAYRIRNGASAEPAMAVIVQQMVEADVAGTAYTANPVTGDPQSVSVAVRLGERESEQYSVSLGDLSVAAHSSSANVDEAKVRLIAEQSILIEDVIGDKVDVEWAMDRDGVWILQAGPIVDLPAHFPIDWADESESGALWVRDDARPISYFARSLIACGPDQRIVNGYLYSRRENAPACDPRARAKLIDEAANSLKDWQKRISPGVQEQISAAFELNTKGLDHASLLRSIDTMAAAARTSYEWMDRAARTTSRLVETLRELVEDGSLAWRLLGGVADAVFERDTLLQELAERFAIAEPQGKLNDEKWWREYKGSVERFTRDYGYAFRNPGEAVDLSGWRSWIEDTDPVFRMIDAVSRRGPGLTLVTRNCAAEQEARIAESDKLKRVRKLVETARGWVAARTESERDRARSTAWLRMAMAELSGRLVKTGAISSSDDTYLLSLAELGSIAAEPDASERTELAAKLARRKHDMWLERRLVAPNKLPINDIEAGRAEKAEGCLIGAAASAGIVSGRARIVTSVEEAAAIAQGDILVVAASGSAWTPFFAIAGGFVCEAGDEVSPEAIAARTYGIPAIMNCPQATLSIREGQKITLDGGTGTVGI